MDFKQLENLLKISEANSINKASLDLYISQSALNQQLLHLEDELGVKLFQRSKSGVLPTEAGKIFLKYADELLAKKKELIAVMNDCSSYKTGTIKVGLPTVRGYEMFTNIFPKFYSQYPGMKLEPMELPVKRQIQLISQGKLDLAFMTLTESDQSEDEFLPIMEEEIFLTIPAAHPLLRRLKGDEVDLRLFKQEKFVLIYKDSSLRKLTDSLFQKCMFMPNVLLETANHQTISNIVSNGYACAIIPKLYISDHTKVRFFHINGRPSWRLCAAHKKGTYLSQPVKDFLQMATDYWVPGK